MGKEFGYIYLFGLKFAEGYLPLFFEAHMTMDVLIGVLLS